MSTMTELFGSMVFDDKVMEARLPKETYKAMQKTIKDGLPLVDLEVANVVANAMKDWYRKGRYPFYTLVPAHDRHYR